MHIENINEIEDRIATLIPSFDLRDKALLEEYNLLIYFKLLLINHSINLPITITKGESPDYVVENGNNSFGIEITHATVDNHFNNLKKQQDYPHSIVEIDKNGVSHLRKEHEGLCCEPFFGDEAERLWANLMSTTLANKTFTFSKPGFTKFNKNILLIRDFTNLPIRDFKSPVYLLINNNRPEIKNYFNEITIILSDNCLIHDVFGKCIKLNLDILKSQNTNIAS